MKNETLSGVYAAALLELAQEKGELERVHEEVLYVASLLRDDPSFRTFLESPKIERSEKLRVVEATLRGKLADSLVNFMGLVIGKSRTLYLPKMLADFQALHDKRAGIVHASAVTAVPLSEASKAALIDVLAAKLHKRIQLENKVDAEILGGLVVRYEGLVADASIKTALRKIGSSMNAIKLGSQLVHEN